MWRGAALVACLRSSHAAWQLQPDNGAKCRQADHMARGRWVVGGHQMNRNAATWHGGNLATSTQLMMPDSARSEHGRAWTGLVISLQAASQRELNYNRKSPAITKMSQDSSIIKEQQNKTKKNTSLIV